MKQCLSKTQLNKSSISKKQVIKLNITQQKHRDNFKIFELIKQGILIHESCRIFQNTQTNAITFVTFQDAKKGKIPVQDNLHMIAAIDFDRVTNKPKIRFWGQQQQTEMFMSIKNHSDKNLRSYPLNLGDVINYADCSFKVVVMESNLIEQKIEGQDFRRKMKSFHFQKEGQMGICKICYGEQCQSNDFLIRPCDCKGSVSALHFSCLKKWLTSKTILLKHTQSIQTYSFKKFICQICKKQLPKCIVHKNTIHYLFDIMFKKCSYMILEQVNTQIWHIYTLNQGQVTSVGSSPDAELTILSRFIKRYQSQIFYKHGNFRIRDMVSQHKCYLTMYKSCVTIQFENSAEIVYDELVFNFSMVIQQ